MRSTGPPADVPAAIWAGTSVRWHRAARTASSLLSGKRFVRLDVDLYEHVLAGCSLTSPDCASAAGPGGSIPFGRSDAALPRNSSRPQPLRPTPDHRHIQDPAFHQPHQSGKGPQLREVAPGAEDHKESPYR